MQHTPLYYLSTVNKYLGKFGVYEPEEVVEADRLEKIWKESQVNYSIHQLLEIFPEALPVVKRRLTAEIKQYKADLSFAEEWKEKFYNKITYRVDFNNRWFYIWLRDWLLGDLVEGKEAQIKKNYFMLSSLKPTKDLPTGKITAQDIARAKEHPLTTYLKVNHAGFAQCPFHGKDKTPSLKVYKNNRWYCFSCSAGTDTIDFVMRLYNLKFLEAVKRILNI